MKCPQCGHEMVLDEHRKYAIHMCYECGYIEGRMTEKNSYGKTNFAHLKGLNFNEAVAFISEGLGIEEAKIADWLDNIHEAE